MQTMKLILEILLLNVLYISLYLIELIRTGSVFIALLPCFAGWTVMLIIILKTRGKNK